MAETPLDLQDILRRHSQVASARNLTKAEHDRGALIAEVDRLRAEKQRLLVKVDDLRAEVAALCGERRSRTA